MSKQVTGVTVVVSKEHKKDQERTKVYNTQELKHISLAYQREYNQKRRTIKKKEA